MSAEIVYREKMNRLQTAFSKGIPDRVPVLPNIETWIMHYAGVSLKDAFTKDPEILFSAFKKVADEIYLDGFLGTSNIIPLKMMKKFGEGIYTVTDDSLQIKGSHGTTMEPDEYPGLIEDPQKFFSDVIIPRKYPVLNQSSDKNLALFEEAFDDFKDFAVYNGSVVRRIETELGMPVMSRAAGYVAPDIILDYLRDFTGIAGDIRRRPNELIAACHSISNFVIQMVTESYKTPNDEHFVFSPLHLPTFLKPKDFEKFYFPFMKKFVEELSVKRGYTILFYMENDWMPYLDILQALPDEGKVIGLFEHGDLKTYKERIGKKMTIMGGMPISLLARGTKQQCIDKAKECLDTLAPGGNYIFSVDMVLMAKTDALPENVISTFQYVHENGKY
ncbi:uroporphyrinogen decarboxylase family protein [Alkalibacter mobilis]|uniref:uroporphyrinogen decarboxylase family protein n=1 Tax=Alkalibacter mobilis TaxID=2787712 RepID=UPI00189EBF86|nr:uroporphyrinogen decarboxylase family protein [Alkalibacter mobilis]MBF7097514.1 hypothetical protein [Alkalibacter mobilis]